MLGRFGFHVLSVTNPEDRQFLPFALKDVFFNELLVFSEKQILVASTYSELVFFSYQNMNLELLERVKLKSWGLSSLAAYGEKVAVFLDMYNNTAGNFQIWSNDNFVKEIGLDFDLGGLFTGCFFKGSNRAICGGRKSIIYFLNLDQKIIDTKIELNEIVKNSVLKSIAPKNEFVYCLDITPDDRFLAIASTIRAVIIWDLNLKQIAHTLEFNEENYSTNLKFSTNGKYLAVHIENIGVKLYDTNTWNVIYSKKAQCRTVKFSVDSKYLVFGGDDYQEGEIFVLDIVQLTIVTHFNARMKYTGLSIKNLFAPSWYIKFYLDRGAINWFTEEELSTMSEEDLETILTFLHRRRDDDTRPKEEKVAEIIKYLYRN
jgi:hypothetical protein